MLIGLTGRAGAGKDTVYETMVELYPHEVVERRSFADPLYESAAAALGVTPDDLRRWKRDDRARVAVGFRHQRGPAGLATGVEITVRQYLQMYGTEAHRRVFGDDFWVEAADLRNHRGRIVAVTDVRFENEALAVQRAGGFVVRVIGPNEGPVEHASEVPIDSDLVYATVENVIRDDNRALLKALVRALVRGLRSSRGEMP